jgi:3-oxoacyl-[acyl-carrier-protein] synthase-3
MYHSKIAGLGFYVPSTNVTICQKIDTNDEWIQENRDSRKKTHNKRNTTTMGVKLLVAIARSGVAKEDIDFVVFALSPDYYFPGPGVLVQRDLGLRTVGALDVRNQCSGFIYALSVADQYIKTECIKTFW